MEVLEAKATSSLELSASARLKSDPAAPPAKVSGTTMRSPGIRIRPTSTSILAVAVLLPSDAVASGTRSVTSVASASSTAMSADPLALDTL